MGFYIRFFDKEAVIASKEEIPSYLRENSNLGEKEMEKVSGKLGQLRSGTNRIYVDSKRYILIISTAKTTLEEFKKKVEKPEEHLGTEQPLSSSSEEGPQEDVLQSGWHEYALIYDNMESGEKVSYTFRARLLDSTIRDAYTRMARYINTKYNGACNIPPLCKDVFYLKD